MKSRISTTYTVSCSPSLLRHPQVKQWPHGCDDACQQWTLKALVTCSALLLVTSLYARYLYVTYYSDVTGVTSTRYSGGVIQPAMLGHGSMLDAPKHAAFGAASAGYRNLQQHGRQISTVCRSNKKVCDLYFIKVHKTGGTTLQNILYRFGFANNLRFAIFDCGNGMTYPNPASRRYLIGPENVYNVMAEHAQWDNSSFRSYMPRDVRTISLLRHPLDFLQSTISFHELQNKMFISTARDVTKTFLRHPEDFDNLTRFTGSSFECGPVARPSYTRNAMAHHFGLSNQSESRRDVIDRFIHDLDSQLTFVMILEKFDESLVLLKRLFKWTLRDVLYIPLWSLKFHYKRDVKPAKRSQEDRNDLIELHKQWSPVDYQLYEHYNNSLHSILQNMSKNYWQEVATFKKHLQTLKQFCVSICDHVKSLRNVTRTQAEDILSRNETYFKKTPFNSAFNVTYFDCIAMTQGTLIYQNAIKVQQNPGDLCRLGTDKRVHAYCNRRDYLVNGLPWRVVQKRMFRSVQQCNLHFVTQECASTRGGGTAGI